MNLEKHQAQEFIISIIQKCISGMDTFTSDNGTLWELSIADYYSCNKHLVLKSKEPVQLKCGLVKEILVWFCSDDYDVLSIEYIFADDTYREVEEKEFLFEVKCPTTELEGMILWDEFITTHVEEIINCNVKSIMANTEVPWTEA
jgi:hypothetical protein